MMPTVVDSTLLLPPSRQEVVHVSSSAAATHAIVLFIPFMSLVGIVRLKDRGSNKSLVIMSGDGPIDSPVVLDAII